MNAVNFPRTVKTLGIAVWMLTYAVAASAKSPTTESSATDRPALILSLPDRWLESDRHPLSSPTQADHIEPNPIQSQHKSGQAKLNATCNMDLNQNTLSDAPLGNRIGGNCELGYRY